MHNIKKYYLIGGPILVTLIGFIIFCPFFFTSCTPEFEDTSIDRKWLDSLEKKGKVALSIEIDSLCELRKEKFIKNAVDSIIGERLEEMRKFNE